MNTPANLSMGAHQNQSYSRAEELLASYEKVELLSAVLLVLLSPITVFTNGLFLYTLYQDSINCFRRTPTTVFIAGLSFADMVTGLFVEPAFAIHYFAKFFRANTNVLHATELVFSIGGFISTVAISTSFVIVLAMSLSQYIAIQYPHKYKTIITSKRVVRLLGLSGLYFFCFSLLQFSGMSRKQFLLIDVALHPTIISCLLIIVHVLMRKAFRKRVALPARKRTTMRKATRLTLGANLQENEPEIIESLITSPSILKPSSTYLSPSQYGSSTSPKPISISSSSPRGESSNLDTIHSPTNRTSREASLTTVLQSSNCSTEVNDVESCTEIIESADNLAVCRLQSLKRSQPEDENHQTISMVPENKNDVRKPTFSVDSNIYLDEAVESHQVSAATSAGLKKPRIILSRYHSGKGRRSPIERQFAIMSFYLSAILLVSSISHMIVFYVFLLKTPASLTEDVYINIGLRVTDLMLFVKVCLDAFIYAWRLPAYRRSLIRSILCRKTDCNV